MSSFQFNFEQQFQKAKKFIGTRINGISISLPFLSIEVEPKDVEKEVAKEIVIRLADRRVLNAKECCDNCIDNALRSLQEIRSNLVDKQVELSSYTNGVLYLLIEYMLEAIRQFLTFEQKLRKNSPEQDDRHPDFWREAEIRKEYFEALEILRSHLYRCLFQISLIADVQIPKIDKNMRYNADWNLKNYRKPNSLSKGDEAV